MRWTRGAAWDWARWALVLLVGAWGLSVAVGTDEPLLSAAIVAGLTGALALSPRLPLVALAGVFVGMFAWGTFVEGQGDDPFIAMLVLASYVVGRHAAMARQPWAAAGVLLLLATNVTEEDRDVAIADVVFPVLLTAGPWLLGLVVQLALRREQAAVSYARQIDAAREEEVRRATTEERLRIARELHDEVAHSVSALSLQAQVLRRGVAAGGHVAEDDLRGIESTAQQAMTDLRRLLGLLRPGDDVPLAPQRGLSDVDELVAEVRAAGQEVRFSREGEPRPVTPVLGAAAYRILQEALTNARRHGGGLAEVVLRQSPGRLEILVSNPLGGQQEVRPGHGTTGMLERVELFGGELTCGPRDRRWVVHAMLPAPVVEVVP